MPHYLVSLEKVRDHLEARKSVSRSFHEASVPSVTPEELSILEKKGLIRLVEVSSKHQWYEPTEAFYNPYQTNIFSKITVPQDLFDIIVGYDDIKRMIRMMVQAEAPTHFLFEGESSSAKTLFLLELSRIDGAQYILGGNTTLAGLNQLLATEIPLILLIDEIDKIKSMRNLDILHSLMETGILVDTKYDKHVRMQLNTRVFASCNDAARLPSSLLSKFGEPVHFSSYTREQFIEIAVRVLIGREGLDNGLAEEVAYTTYDAFGSNDVRQAIKIARMAKEGMRLSDIILTLKRYRKFE